MAVLDRMRGTWTPARAILCALLTGCLAESDPVSATLGVADNDGGEDSDSSSGEEDAGASTSTSGTSGSSGGASDSSGTSGATSEASGETSEGSSATSDASEGASNGTEGASEESSTGEQVSDCCYQHVGRPGCDDPEIEAAVCALDVGCCIGRSWGATCVEKAMMTGLCG